ncbi:hypothetical protein [Mycobacterium tuberculosis]|uniref:hypothetical protein n=1 Tax=Mycobacterium tuberculosis TaxID=1773 RepID=UPI00272CE85F|nr:hypothetical protein [Mycobacterium tuberculosis]
MSASIGRYHGRHTSSARSADQCLVSSARTFVTGLGGVWLITCSAEWSRVILVSSARTFVTGLGGVWLITCSAEWSRVILVSSALVGQRSAASGRP